MYSFFLVDTNLVYFKISETIKVRPLAQSPYKNAQRDISITEQPEMPQKTSGLMNKALDLFFGW